MTTLRFRATADMSTFVYRKGGRVERTVKGGGTAKVLAEPLILRHGDTVHVDEGDEEGQWAATWCANNLPLNFSIEGGKAKAATPELDFEPSDFAAVSE